MPLRRFSEWTTLPAMIEHLYAHIPFCPKVCPYCSFYKEAGDRNKTRAFLDAMLAEAEKYASVLQPRTIFFGGGTPSALSTPQLEFLLGGLRERIDFPRVTEWTLEMNPATVSLEKARALVGLGVNRISMGVQSWDDGLLQTLGRVHSAAQAGRSYRILRDAGCANVNLDLIFGIPGQTTEQWRASLERTIALDPDHISAYCLTYEEDTDFFLRLQRGEMRPDEERDAALFELTMDVLGEAGYAQYEISNYARAGRECRHNLAYWTAADYVGLGPSAFSTVGESRWKNVSDTADYVRRVNAAEDTADFRETVDPRIRRAEQLAFALRTSEGIADVGQWSGEIQNLRAAGYLEPRGDGWVLTRAGKLVADAIAETFV
ncbi:MAG: radical SAM family heme chaperone HemW [Terrimicrobiaceae bacterium]|nr:radical SAM family heme chaperone HemW [Terrimicrobiaceae bacterium]